MTSSGYAGKTLMPRDAAQALRKFWRNYELTKGLATLLGESQGSIGAWHDNYDGDKLLSRDCGLMQINIPARYVGTNVEYRLRTDSFDPDVWADVMRNNVDAAWRLYNQPWTRDGKQDIRRWQPWVAYTSGWATFPEWWVWHQDADHNPVGPWLATGRFVHKAVAGQMNNLIVNERLWTPEVALSYGKKYAAHFGIDPDRLYINTQKILAWHIPAKPTDPPADGVGPRPTTNDGT